MHRKCGVMLPKQSKIASAVITMMLLSAGAAHAGTITTAPDDGTVAEKFHGGRRDEGVQFINRKNPDNSTNEHADTATKDGQYLLKGGTNFAAAGATATRAGIAIGDHAQAVGNDTHEEENLINGGAIAIGQGAQGLHNSAIALGTVARASGQTALAIGRQSNASGDLSMALGNVADATGKSAIALGNSANASGDQAVAIGGAGSSIYYDEKNQTKAGGKKSVALGAGAKATTENSVAVGAGSVAADANTDMKFGQSAPIGGAVSFGSGSLQRQLKNVAAGADDTDAVNVAQVQNVKDELQGNINTVDAKTKNTVHFTDDSHNTIKLDGKNGGTTISGVKAGTADTDAVNVGQLNKKAGEITNTVTNNINSGATNAVIYDSNKHDSVTLGGVNATAPVALKNVADGAVLADSTDAVNGRQLHHATQSAANNFGGGSTADEHGNITAPTYNVANGSFNNVGDALTAVDGRVANVESNVSTIGDQVTTNTQNITKLNEADTRNVKYDGKSGFDTVTLAGGKEGTRLTNVKAGNLAADSKDAVNGSQLFETNQNVSKQTTRVDNLTTNVTTLTSNLSVTNQNVTDLQAADKLNVKYDSAAKDSVTLGGKDAKSVKLSNVADGSDKHDAVNVGQLSRATDGLQSQIDVHNDKITNIDGRVTQNTKNIGQNTTDISALKQDALQWNSTLGAYDASHGTASPQTIANVKAGQADTDAVNVKQLKDNISSGVNNGSTNAVLYDTDKNGKRLNSVSLQGGAAGPVTINNVAEGKLSKDSTQAVNGSQLFATNQTVAAQGTSIKAIDQRVTVNEGDIKSIKGDVSNITDVVNDHTTSINVLQKADERSVKYDGQSGNFDSITLAGGKEGTRISNVKDGIARDDAANMGQLRDGITEAKNYTDTQVSNLNTTIGTATKNAVQYDGDNHTSVTLGGANASAPVSLHNIADGVKANDAVNVGQLSKVESIANNANQGWNVAVNNGTSSRVHPGDTVVFQDDGNNIALKQDGQTITVGMKDDVKFNSVSIVGGPSLSVSGIDMGGKKITNVGSGEIKAGSTDAVNGGDVYKVVQQQTTEATKNAVQYDTNIFNDRLNSVTLEGGKAGPVSIKNVAVGRDKTDAVNVEQLHNTATIFGAGAQVNPDGSINAPTYEMNRQADGSVSTYHNVGDALKDIDGRTTANTTNIKNLQDSDALSVKYDSSAKNSVTFGGSSATSPVVLKNVAAGTDDTDGVNVKQLKDSVSSGVNNGSTNAVLYDTDKNGKRLNSVSLIGSGNSAVVINNVADGKVAKDSTQAINGSQLFGNISNTLGGGAGATFTTVNNVTQVTYKIGDGKGGQTTVNGVGGAIENLDGRTTKIENNVQQVVDGKAGLVQQQDPHGDITVGKDSGGKSVNFSGKDGDRVLTGIADGKIANGSKDAVNGGQLNQVIQTIDNNNRITVQSVDGNTKWIARADAGSIGSTATATGKNSVAVGQGSVADRDNSFSVGSKGNERQVTNVADGTAPTDAVNVRQLNANIAGAQQQSNNYTDQRINQVYKDMDGLKKDAYAGTAAAMALGNLPQSWAPGRGIVTAGAANYRGQSAFAAGYSYRTENDRWTVKAAVSGDVRSGVGGAVSAGFMY